MKVEITNIRKGTRLAAAWQSKRDGGHYFVPAGSWIHTEGRTTTTQRGFPQRFGYYVIRASLEGFEVFEYVFPVTEELTTVKISYKKIK